MIVMDTVAFTVSKHYGKIFVFGTALSKIIYILDRKTIMAQIWKRIL